MFYIIKRDGRKQEFNRRKIEHAIEKAFIEKDGEISEYDEEKITSIADYIENKCRQDAEESNKEYSVEEIQDLVEIGLMRTKRKDVARAYIIYRNDRNRARGNNIDSEVEELLSGNSEYWSSENSNKNEELSTTQRDYMAGIVSTDLAKRKILPRDVLEAHNEGILHVHDMDYLAQHMHNCDLINLEDMLQNGTVISETYIEKPHSFSTACNVATQIIAQVASAQYGGQSISLAALAPFVDVSRQKIKSELIEELEMTDTEMSEEKINKIVEKRLKKEIKKGVQTIQYQVVTLMTTNGQAPFITVFMYLDEVEDGRTREDLALVIEETLNQRIQGVKNEKGVWISPAFPKLIYCLDEDNIREDSKYYYLTELAAKCSAKRLVPDYISAKLMKELKGDVYTCMGCRSFLTPDRFTDAGIGNIANAKNYVEGKHKYYGRFNQGVVTINLVDIACSSGKDINKFWELFDERLEFCHKALMCRHKQLLGTRSDVAPILWQYGALARLEKGEKIDKLLFNGYSTISLGYAGLYECVMYMTGKSHTDSESKPFALEVMQYMNDVCAKWKAESNIDFSLYGTPLESTTYKFAKALKRRFGEIENVTDHNYITNSYHINVRENISWSDKLKFESEFQKLSPGGAISYVETPNLQNNNEAVLEMLKFMYENIMYSEINTKSDYCQVCGYDGEIKIKEKEDGTLFWECPNCGNRDENKLNVARRTCGLTSSNSPR